MNLVRYHRVSLYLCLRLAVVAGLATVTANCSRGASEAERETPAYVVPSYATVDERSVETALRFTDVTVAAGIEFRHETGAFGRKWMPETVGSGAGFFDYDRDGWPDIILINGSQWPGHARTQRRATLRLYRNLGNGRFLDVTSDAGLTVTVYGMGVAIADYDADQDLDVYVTAVGENKLLRNDDGRFVDVTSEMAVHGNDVEPGSPPAWSTGAAWLDVNRDGWLDLFVCNYVRWTPETDLFTTLDGTTKSYATPQQYQGESCRLYRSRQGRRFEDVTKAAGVLNHDGKSLGVAVEDINDDGWPDIMVSNDTERNFLYVNRGDGTFDDIAMAAGVGYDEFGRARAGMGVDVADVGNDGRLSIAIGNFSREPVSLYTQVSLGLFQDLAGRARLTGPTLRNLTFGLVYVDLDLDGYLDLLLGNGHIEPDINRVQQDITFAQTPQLFLNTGTGHFTDASGSVGASFQEPMVARGIALADYDRDGDPDILFSVNGASPKLFRNELPAGSSNWIGIRLEGNPPNTSAIGAVVTLYAGELRQRRMIRTGSSYLSQSDVSWLIYGLGLETSIDSVTVRWPTTGTVSTLGAAAARRRYVIRERAPALDAER